MMIEEFVARTGFKPTYDEYQAIEKAYYEFDGDKNQFCAAWLVEYRNAKHNVLNHLLRQLGEIYETTGKTPEYYAIRNIVMGF